MEKRMAKLNIEIEAALFDRVQRYSEQRGTDVSRTISDLIQHLPEHGLDPSTNGGLAGTSDDWEQALPPITRSLLGIASGDADESQYKDYLWRKYGP